MAQTSVGEIGLDVVVNSNGLNRQFNALTGMAKKAGVAMAAAFSVKALTGFSKQAISLGSDLAEVQNVVDVTFPSMSAQVDKFAQSAAQSFGLSETMAKKYTGTFGAMSKAFGFTEKEAYNMSTALTGLAGDVASFYNLSQDEAYTKLKSVFTGETESLKDLGVVMTQTALDQYAVSNGFGKTTSAMSEQEKVALRYRFVLDQLSLANGDFARTQDSWANQSRILALQWQSFMASVGQGLINLLTPALKALNMVMAKLVQLANAFKSFTSALGGKKGGGGSSGGANLTTGLKSTESSANGASSSLGNVGKSAKKAAKAAKKAAKDLMGFDKITKLSEKTKSSGGSGAGAGSGSGGSVGGIGGGDFDLGETTVAQEAAGGRLSRIWNNLRKALIPLKKAMSEFGGVIKSLGGYLYKNVVKPFAKWTIKKALPAIVRLLAAAFGALAKVLKALSPVGKFLFEKVLKPIGKLLGKVFLRNIKLVTKYFNAYGTVVEKVSNGLKGVREKMQGFSISSAFEGAKEKIAEAAEALTGFDFDGVKEVAVSVSAKIDSVLQGVMNFIENPKETVINVASKVASSFSDVVDFVKEKAKAVSVTVGAIVQSAFTTAKAAWDAVVSSDAVKTVKGAIGDKFNDVKDAWEKIVSRPAKLTASLVDKIKNGGLTSLKKKWASINSKPVTITAKFKGKLDSVKKKWDSLKSKSIKISVAAKGQIDDIKAKVNDNIIKPLNKRIAKIPYAGKKISIPLLAQGAYVQPNTPQLAMIGDNRHQGEVVAPEDKMRAMAVQAAQMAGNNGGITRAEMQAIMNASTAQIIRVLNSMGVYFDSEEIAKLVNKGNKAINRRYSPVG